MQRQPRLEAFVHLPVPHEQEALDLSSEDRPWTEQELRHILGMVPMQENYLLLARLLKRTPESIEAIFRWAAED